MPQDLQAQRLGLVFDTMDPTADGYVTLADFETVGDRLCTRLDTNGEHRQAVMAAYRAWWEQTRRVMDTDGDGRVSRRDFVDAIRRGVGEDPGYLANGIDRVIAALARAADADSDGYVSEDEYFYILSGGDVKRQSALTGYYRMDRDGGGWISVEDFGAAVRAFFSPEPASTDLLAPLQSPARRMVTQRQPPARGRALIEDLTLSFSAAERMLWEAFPLGDPVEAHRLPDGRARTVRAELIRALLLGARQPESGYAAGVWLSGAHIDGVLDLSHVDTPYPLTFTGCVLNQAPILYWARIRGIRFVSCRLPGMDASSAQLDGHLLLRGCEISGCLWLAGARVSGMVNLGGSRLSNPLGCVLVGDRLTADSGMFCDDGFHARGEVRLRGAGIGRCLSFNDSRLDNPTGTALDCDALTVNGDVHCASTIDGRTRFVGAVIDGRMELRGSFSSLDLRLARAGYLTVRPREPIKGLVDLRQAHTAMYRDNPAQGQAQLRLEGFTYEALDPVLDARSRLRWLAQDQTCHDPQAHEQLAGRYRALGRDADARQVLLAGLRARRTLASWPLRIWGLAQDWTVGYGYRPQRAAAWLVLLLLLGIAGFTLYRPVPRNPGTAPEFSPVFYTLDLLLPLISFGQEDAFAPQGGWQWLAFFLTSSGWGLASTIAAGVTRTLRRE
ncbi:EF-hand domain-containing protein [Longispora albida]|uniref:EF-hand domain-containing protein n=1 Tax=Longispora albida TaxID=203523 RepID=UPI0003693FE5|nr:EF-hand domain-containing protein [Longispora albida]